MGLEVDIDRDVCMGSGNCVYEAPGVFDLDGDSVAFVVDSDRGARGGDRLGRAQVPDDGDLGPTGRCHADLSTYEAAGA